MLRFSTYKIALATFAFVLFACCLGKVLLIVHLQELAQPHAMVTDAMFAVLVRASTTYVEGMDGLRHAPEKKGALGRETLVQQTHRV